MDEGVSATWYLNSSFLFVVLDRFLRLLRKCHETISPIKFMSLYIILSVSLAIAFLFQ
jgi:hypothetical protein